MFERIEDDDREMGEVTFVACRHGEPVDVSTGRNHRVLHKGVRMAMALSGVDISQSPKAVVLQLEDVVWIVERLFTEP